MHSWPGERQRPESSREKVHAPLSRPQRSADTVPALSRYHNAKHTVFSLAGLVGAVGGPDRPQARKSRRATGQNLASVGIAYGRREGSHSTSAVRHRLRTFSSSCCPARTGGIRDEVERSSAHSAGLRQRRCRKCRLCRLLRSLSPSCPTSPSHQS